MIDEILNVMTEDELRNYAHKMNDLEKAYGDFCYTKDEIIEALERAYRSRVWAKESSIHLEYVRDDLARLEDELERKYWDKIPHPTPTCEPCVKDEVTE